MKKTCGSQLGGLISAGDSRECREERGDGRIVAEGLAEMDVAVHICGAEHETPAQLKGIPARAVLPMARRFGAFARGCVVAAKKMQQRSLAQFGGAIGQALLVNEQRKLDTGLLAENSGVAQIPQTDGREARAFFEEFVLVIAQLRDMFPAEDSTVVPEKYDDRGTLGPQRPEAHRIGFRVGQQNWREISADGFGHEHLIFRPKGWSRQAP
jgi:hypothetical protein